MINPRQFRTVVKDVLYWLETEGGIPFSADAVELMLMTAAHESRLGSYLYQEPSGIAKGVFQMEGATEKDIWDNYLAFRPDLRHAVTSCKSVGVHDNELVYNLRYAIVMARIHYYRVPEALPRVVDYATEEEYLQDLAEYAKQHYNTVHGKATAAKYYVDYKTFYG